MKFQLTNNFARRLGLAVCARGLVGGLSRTTSAQTADPPRQPILRIETGMHTAIARRIGVDRAAKFLVTASEDKTARVWELQTGRLLRVLPERDSEIAVIAENRFTRVKELTKGQQHPTMISPQPVPDFPIAVKR